jgi:hypothetical protein
VIERGTFDHFHFRKAMQSTREEGLCEDEHKSLRKTCGNETSTPRVDPLSVGCTALFWIS